MRKGQIKREWTPEQKSEIVHKHLDEHISLRIKPIIETRHFPTDGNRKKMNDRPKICGMVITILIEYNKTTEFLKEGGQNGIPKTDNGKSESGKR